MKCVHTIKSVRYVVLVFLPHQPVCLHDPAWTTCPPYHRAALLSGSAGRRKHHHLGWWVAVPTCGGRNGPNMWPRVYIVPGPEVPEVPGRSLNKFNEVMDLQGFNIFMQEVPGKPADQRTSGLIIHPSRRLESCKHQRGKPSDASEISIYPVGLQVLHPPSHLLKR